MEFLVEKQRKALIREWRGRSCSSSVQALAHKTQSGLPYRDLVGAQSGVPYRDLVGAQSGLPYRDLVGGEGGFLRSCRCTCAAHAVFLHTTRDHSALQSAHGPSPPPPSTAVPARGSRSYSIGWSLAVGSRNSGVKGQIQAVSTQSGSKHRWTKYKGIKG